MVTLEIVGRNGKKILDFLVEHPKNEGYTIKQLESKLKITRQTISKHCKNLLDKGLIKIYDNKHKLLSLEDLESLRYSKPIKFYPQDTHIPTMKETLFNPLLRDNNFQALMLGKFVCVKYCEENLEKEYEDLSKGSDKELDFILQMIYLIVFKFSNSEYFEPKFKDGTEDYQNQFSEEIKEEKLIMDKYHVRDKAIKEIYEQFECSHLTSYIEKTKEILDNYTKKLVNEKSIYNLIEDVRIIKDFKFLRRFYKVLEFDLKHNLKRTSQNITSQNVELPLYTLLGLQQKFYNAILEEIYMRFSIYNQMEIIDDLKFSQNVEYTPGREIRSFFEKDPSRFNKIKKLLNDTFGLHKDNEKFIPFGSFGLTLDKMGIKEESIRKHIAKDIFYHYLVREIDLLGFEEQMIKKYPHLSNEIEEYNVIQKFYEELNTTLRNVLGLRFMKKPKKFINTEIKKMEEDVEYYYDYYKTNLVFFIDKQSNPNLKKCIECGKGHKEPYSYCKECWDDMTKICPECNQEHIEYGKYCYSCTYRRHERRIYDDE